MTHREKRLLLNVVALILIAAIIVAVGIYVGHTQDQVNKADRQAHCILLGGTAATCR